MGLDTSHDCWHGPYSTFAEFRRELARAAGLPPLDSMEGFAEDGRAIQWSVLKPDALIVLLNHSDCEGEIATADCLPLAVRLEELAPLMSDNVGLSFRAKTLQFAAGLRKAHAAGEPIDFH